MTSTLRERDGLLRENWYVACLGKELKSGRPLHRVIYDKPYVLFRDAEGRAAALPDRCLHRHAPLSAGVVIDGQIACPYHGWMYDRGGKVVHVPSEGDSAKPHRSPPLCMKPVPVVEQDDCVWLWMGDSAPRTAAPPYRFPHLGESGWMSYFMVTDFDNEVTNLVENFMDVPHTVFVHRGWFRSPARIKVPISVDTRAGRVLVTYDQPSDAIGFTTRALNPRREPMTHTDCYIFPNITRVDYNFGTSRSFIISSQCTPVSTLKTRVYTAIIFRMGWMNPLLYPLFRFYTRQVIEQDVDIMAIQSRSFRFDMKCDFNNTDADELHREIEGLRARGIVGEPAETVTGYAEKEMWI